MPLPPVVVELGDSTLAPELRETLLHACTRAVTGGECVDAEVASTSEPRAVAILSWSDDGTVRIQVGLRDPPRWRTRTLRFAAEDDVAEICTAVGFAAGTLATTMERGEPEEDTAEPSPATAEPAATPAPTSPSPKREPGAGTGAAPPAAPRAREPRRPEPPSATPRRGFLTVDAAALVGSGVEPDAARVGPRLMVTAWAPKFASFSLRGEVAWVILPPLGMGYRITSFGGGPGGSVRAGSLRASARTLAGAERLDVYAIAVDRSKETAGRWVGWAGLGAELEWPCRWPVRPVVAGEAVWPFGTTDVLVYGIPRDLAPRLHVTGTLGLRVGSTCHRP